jgi:hypothetical protein
VRTPRQSITPQGTPKLTGSQPPLQACDGTPGTGRSRSGWQKRVSGLYATDEVVLSTSLACLSHSYALLAKTVVKVPEALASQDAEAIRLEAEGG